MALAMPKPQNSFFRAMAREHLCRIRLLVPIPLIAQFPATLPLWEQECTSFRFLIQWFWLQTSWSVSTLYKPIFWFSNDAAQPATWARIGRSSCDHLLFLHDFSVPFDDNMSERDLRKVKNRQKMAGGFRKDSGHEMYCAILTIIETLKRRNMGLIENVKKLFKGAPAIF